MLLAQFHMTPFNALKEVQQTFEFSDGDLAIRLGVAPYTLQRWREGSDSPPATAMRHMSDLLRLAEALQNARSGKYRQA